MLIRFWCDSDITFLRGFIHKKSMTVLYFSIINVFWLLNLCGAGGEASFAPQANLVMLCFKSRFYQNTISGTGIKIIHSLVQTFLIQIYIKICCKRCLIQGFCAWNDWKTFYFHSRKIKKWFYMTPHIKISIWAIKKLIFIFILKINVGGHVKHKIKISCLTLHPWSTHLYFFSFSWIIPFSWQ